MIDEIIGLLKSEITKYVPGVTCYNSSYSVIVCKGKNHEFSIFVHDDGQGGCSVWCNGAGFVVFDVYDPEFIIKIINYVSNSVRKYHE